MSVMVGASESNGYQIREEDSYDDALLMCGGHEFVDDALSMIDEALCKNPLGFQKFNRNSDIHFAKTKLRIRRGSVIPAMTLFFTVDEAKRIVTKLHVKYSSPEEMAISDDPWNEQESPF
jgi:hypothetical protein